MFFRESYLKVLLGLLLLSIYFIICQALKSWSCFPALTLFSLFQKVATSDDVTLENFSASLLTQLTSRGLDTKLRNMVYYWLKEKCSSFKYFSLEPLDYMKKSQVKEILRLHNTYLSFSSFYKAYISVHKMLFRSWCKRKFGMTYIFMCIYVTYLNV